MIVMRVLMPILVLGPVRRWSQLFKHLESFGSDGVAATEGKDAAEIVCNAQE
jgi:hypothetical protein